MNLETKKVTRSRSFQPPALQAKANCSDKLYHLSKQNGQSVDNIVNELEDYVTQIQSLTDQEAPDKESGNNYFSASSSVRPIYVEDFNLTARNQN